MASSRLAITFSLTIACMFVSSWAVPVVNSRLVKLSELNNSTQTEEIVYDNPVNVTNITFVPKDLIVIRTFIYEVGILTNADPNVKDEDVPVLDDEVDIHYFQPPKNRTIDWWKTFDNNETKINTADVAFERVLPVGMSVLPKEDFDVITLEENEEENEEDNAIELL